MDYFLIGLGILLMISGIVGCVLPFIPGPPLNFLGLVLLHLTSGFQFSTNFLILWGIITAVVYGLDLIIPVWGTKKFGGSNRGIWGSIIGLIAGMFFFPPFGIIIGPFAGAVIGEITAGKESKAALKSGFGSFVGFITGTVLKLIVSGIMTWYFIKELITG